MKIPTLIIIGLLMVLTTMTGCGGYYGPGYDGETVVVSEPDQFLFGGDYDNRIDAHHYSQRGSESRGTAHPAASHAVAHSAASHAAAHSGGGGGKKR